MNRQNAFLTRVTKRIALIKGEDVWTDFGPGE
jgi:hypothetical protein